MILNCYDSDAEEIGRTEKFVGWSTNNTGCEEGRATTPRLSAEGLRKNYDLIQAEEHRLRNAKEPIFRKLRGYHDISRQEHEYEKELRKEAKNNEIEKTQETSM